MPELLLLIPLLIWLLVAMVYDLRYRELPAKLTFIPLILAGIYALLNGKWIAVGFTAALILIADLEPRQRRLLLAGVMAAFAAIFYPAAAVQIFILLMIWLLWDIGAMGGADVKLLMVITLTIQQPAVFVFIALAGGIQGLVALMLHRKEIPVIVAIFAGVTCFALDQLVLKIFVERRKTAMRFIKDNQGIESTEVALIIAVVVLVSYGAYRLLGGNIAAVVQDIAGRI